MPLNAVEYRVKHPDLRWEDTPVSLVVRAVFWTDPETLHHLWNLIGAVVSWLNKGAEVRWNFVDVEQGHYITAPSLRLRPRKKRPCRHKEGEVQ